jgi:hypothetical protein
MKALHGLGQLHRTEPTVLVGALTAVGAFLAQLGGGVDAVQSAGTAGGIAGVQALLTRQLVWSPRSVGRLRSDEPTNSLAVALANLKKTGISGAEPAMMIAVGTFLGGFLTQFFAGVDLNHALLAAGSASGAQGIVTRGRVNSPRSAGIAAAADAIHGDELSINRVLHLAA